MKINTIFHKLKNTLLSSYKNKISLISFASVLISLLLTVSISYNGINRLYNESSKNVKSGLERSNEEYLNNYITITSEFVENKIQRFFHEQAVLADLYQKVLDNENPLDSLLTSMTTLPACKNQLTFNRRWHPADVPNWKAFNPGLVTAWEQKIKINPAIRENLADLAIVKPPSQDGGTGKVIMSMNFPILNKNRDTFRGSISVDVELNEILNYAKNIKLAQTGFAYITQSNGNILAINEDGKKILGLNNATNKIVSEDTGIAYNTMSHFFKDSPYDPVKNIKLPQGRFITNHEITINGNQYIIFQKNLKPLNAWNSDKEFYKEDWTLGFVVPKQELFASYYTVENQINIEHRTLIVKLLGIFTLIVLLAGVAIRILSNKMTVDLKKLEFATLEIMNKNYNVDINIKSNDEIGTLGMAIKKMILEIKATFEKISMQNEILKREMEDRQNKEKIIQYLEEYDPLTNLPNQTLLVNNLETWLPSGNGTLFILGVDAFRKINEMIGFEGGNRILQIFSYRLQTVAKNCDAICRFNGDEFLILYRNLTIVEKIVPIAENIMNSLKPPFLFRDKEIFLTTSIGISCYPRDSLDSYGIIKCATAALSRAKEKGGGQYLFYDAEINKNTEEKIEMINQLRNALANNEFELFYQPQVQMQSKNWVGMEALLRWNNPLLGSVSPTIFIPLAEEAGFINEIGEWVLRTACKQTKIWHNLGYHSLVIAVNVSCLQFTQYNFIDCIKSILQESNLEPKFLELEVTESLFIDEMSTAIHILNELRAMGICIAVDDFGTGYSSLSYIRNLPIDKLKIDRSFIEDIPHKDNGILSNIIIEMAKSLNLKVIAEGVETEAHEKYLIEKKCDDAQGYYYYKPLNVNNFTSELLKNNLLQ